MTKKGKPLYKGRSELTQNYLKEILDYNEDTGKVTWAVNKAGNIKIGDEAGRVKTNGYRGITIDRKEYQLHRIIWFLMYGFFPCRSIDHINGDKLDNRLSNLREATFTQNNQNRGMMSNNKSGYRGVQWIESSQKYRASISVKGKTKHLGLYLTKEEAFVAYCKAILEIPNNFHNLKEDIKYAK